MVKLECFFENREWRNWIFLTCQGIFLDTSGIQHQMSYPGNLRSEIWSLFDKVEKQLKTNFSATLEKEKSISEKGKAELIDMAKSTYLQNSLRFQR